MSKPLPLQNQFMSMRQDGSRNRMPPNTAWNLVDIIPDYGAPARERGGWAAHSVSAVSATTASASYARGGLYAVFSPTGGADEANLFVDEDGLLYEVSQAGVTTLIGSARTLAQNPVFHGAAAASAATAVYTGLVIIPDGTGAAIPKKYDGSSISDLGGTPPKARFAAVYKDYTVLANGTVGTTYFPNRIWFSPPGDPDCAVSSITAWDTTDSWIDFSLPVTALAATKNALLVFGDGQISRVRGSTPPPDEDMVVDDPWQQVGLLDPFSLSNYQDNVYWCAPEGVFGTDGVTLNDYTLKGGMLRYWLDLLAVPAASAYNFSTGIIRNKLVITVMNGSSFVDGFMVDLASYGWTRISNLDAMSLWTGFFGAADETYFASRGTGKIGRLGTMFDVGDSTYKNDGDGDAVASVIETPFYELGRPGLKIVKSVFVGFSLTDFGSDNPTIAVSYVDTPEETSYTSLGTLSEQAAYTRQRITVGGRHWGIGLRFARANAGDLLGYDLSAEIHHQEESKR